MRLLQATARPFVVFVERFYPDPLVFAIALTGLVFTLAWWLTPASPLELVVHWGDGLQRLLAFMAQISITLITAHALAHTDTVRRTLIALSRVPKSAFSAYAFTCFIAGVASLISWAFCLVAGALVAREVAIQARTRGIKVDYALLVASAYGGLVIWHMGYSGSAPLFVATPGNALETALGGLIPVSETIFAPWNIALAMITLFTIPMVCALMAPPAEDVVEIPDHIHSQPEDPLAAAASSVGPETLAQRLDNSRFFTLALGGLLVLYLINWFATRGLDLNLNIVNWTFLAAGLLLSRSAAHYVRLVTHASMTVGQVLIQYPFYAGIMGIMAGSGLASIMAGWFTAIASADTLPFWAFLSGGLINMFVPSGGGQWVVQGPIFLEAAKALGTTPSHIVMGVAYGDQWTNMIQPFWTIPMLAIAGLHMRAIMGYCFVILIATFFIFGGGLLYLGA
jgi:short-chain fatty acids transporter